MKNVLVTGARKGLGLAIARRLSADGYKVIAAARSTSAELTKLCCESDVHYETLDVSHVEILHDWIRRTEKRHGRIYGLVNNAAIGRDGILATMHEKDIQQVLQVNLHAPIILSKYASRSMLLAGQGRIINITSIIAFTGFNGLSVYAATKSGLTGFSRSLSRELGKADITVNCVAPGYMETDMTGDMPSGKLVAIKRRSASGKLAGVTDVAAAVAFLMSDAASMITGTTITVDAGSTA